MRRTARKLIESNAQEPALRITFISADAHGVRGGGGGGYGSFALLTANNSHPTGPSDGELNTQLEMVGKFERISGARAFGLAASL